MTKLLVSAAGVVVGLAALQGQDFGKGQAFQVFGAGNAGLAAGRPVDGAFGGQVVKGKPFSANEERRFIQILGDGNRIETTEMNRVFRDSQGRTRVEDMNGNATILDPVAGTRIVLNPANRTARSANVVIAEAPATLTAQPAGRSGARGATKSGTPENSEVLKPQMVNGVMAQGTRTTITIPRGQIGNDREIKVVTERWVSNDLQTLIKSTNSDPRFGDTTYQLTGIIEREPDPFLFQIPGDYTVNNPGGRGGKGPAVPGGRKGGPAKSNFTPAPGVEPQGNARQN